MMKYFCVAGALTVCILNSMCWARTGQDQKPAAADTSSATGIYNPPRVITPDYTAGEPAGSGQQADTRQGEAGGLPSPRERMGRTGGCAACAGWPRGRVGGGGGPAAGYLFADLGDINRQIKKMGIPTLSENIFVAGGRGYLRIGHFLVGGGGYSGSSESSGIPDCCSRDVTLEIGYGGVILGVTESRRRCELTAGMLLGGGSVEIARRRNSLDVVGWNQAWSGFYADGPDSIATEDLNITSKVTGQFIALEPFASAEYWIMPFMAADLSASYLHAKIGGGDWKLDGVSMPDSPASDIGGWTLRLGLHFGL